MSDKKTPTLSNALAAIQQVFDHYAAQDNKGPKDKLSKKELKQLLQEEMGQLPKTADKTKLSDLFKSMDEDGDGQLDFPEFMMALTMYTCVSRGRSCDMKMKK